MSQLRDNLFPVPQGFLEVLRELASNIIKDHPDDILLYSQIYFESKQNEEPFQFNGQRRANNAEINILKVKEIKNLLEPQVLFTKVENQQNKEFHELEVPTLKAVRPKINIQEIEEPKPKQLRVLDLANEFMHIGSDRSIAMNQSEWKDKIDEEQLASSEQYMGSQQLNPNLINSQKHLSKQISNENILKEKLTIFDLFSGQLNDITLDDLQENKLLNTDNDQAEFEIAQKIAPPMAVNVVDKQLNQNDDKFDNLLNYEMFMARSEYNVTDSVKQRVLYNHEEKMKQIDNNNQISIPDDLNFLGVQNNSNHLKISVVKSTKLGIYKKVYLFVNIMSARNIPNSLNSTCEVYLEGLENQKITSYTSYANLNPDWYYLKKKLVLLVPKDILTKKTDPPFYLIANIYEQSFSQKSFKKINLASFRIPLDNVFIQEDKWSINKYLNCQEQGQKTSLYLQVKFSLPQQETNHSLLEETIKKSNEQIFSQRNTPQSSIMATIDINSGDENHIKIINQLVLSMSQHDKISGTLKIAIVRAKQLWNALNPSEKIISPVVEYTVKLDKDYYNTIKDSNPHVVTEPVWFHTFNQNFEIPLPLKNSSLSLELFDERSDNEKILLGVINIDLSNAIWQPCKWIINGYYDLISSNNLKCGQIFLQAKFIPIGLEEFHQDLFGPLSNLE